MRLILALVFVVWATAAHAFTDCTGPIRVLANSTVPATVFNLPEGGRPSAWLEIVDAGGGTASVAVNGFGPADPSGIAADRATALLGTLNAATTCLAWTGIVQGLQAVVTGCTTTCDLRITLCGTNDGRR